MKVSVITVTHRGDLACFAQLCQTMDRFVPGLVHHVLVDHSDLSLFADFASPNRRIVDTKTILPKFHEFNLGRRRLWWRWPFYLARGWTFQQLVKIAYASKLADDAVLHVDSDMIFVRPLRQEDVFADGKVKLIHNPGKGQGSEFEKWHNVASRCLGLPETGYPGWDYISTAVIWSPEVVREMIKRIERTAKRAWFDALIAHFRFSEYIVYGHFCDRLPGHHRDLITIVDQELCHCSWHYDVMSEEGAAAFVAALQPHHLGILIQSNLGLAMRQRNALLSRFALS